MTIYNLFIPGVNFDFDSTEPAVFRIIVRQRDRCQGMFAEAEFRAGHDDARLESLTCRGETEELALDKLLEELGRYNKETPVHTAEEAMERINRKSEYKKQQAVRLGKYLVEY